jgi:type I restriction enzyme S subunit
LNILKELVIPLPPIEEQRKIIEIIEYRQSIIYELEMAIHGCLKQSEILRQNILFFAFSGGLVPQNPSDEPAETLLNHIRTERMKSETLKKKLSLKKENCNSNQVVLF